jgi:hypothetical protein
LGRGNAFFGAGAARLDVLANRNAVPEMLEKKRMGQVIEFSDTVHFSDGHLSRRVKEMIATYVSALNRCPY